MASHGAERRAARYRSRSADLRARVDARIRALYGQLVDPAAIDASFARFLARAEPLIAAGQASSARLAAAFVASVADELDEALDVDVDESIAGTTRDGRSIPEGMAAIAPMILGKIRDGSSIADAIGLGEFLVGRFTGSELIGAADRELEAAGEAIGPLVGWEGIVAPDACDRCQAENAGEHELTWRPYRHAATCQCVVVPVFGTPPT